MENQYEMNKHFNKKYTSIYTPLHMLPIVLTTQLHENLKQKM